MSDNTGDNTGDDWSKDWGEGWGPPPSENTLYDMELPELREKLEELGGSEAKYDIYKELLHGLSTGGISDVEGVKNKLEEFGAAGNASKIKPLSLSIMASRYQSGELGSITN